MRLLICLQTSQHQQENTAANLNRKNNQLLRPLRTCRKQTTSPPLRPSRTSPRNQGKAQIPSRSHAAAPNTVSSSSHARMPTFERRQACPEKKDGDPQDDGDPQPDEPKPDISKQVEEEVDRRLAPVLNEHSKAADDAELTELFTGDLAPERAKYERDHPRTVATAPVQGRRCQRPLQNRCFRRRSLPPESQAVETYKKAQKEAKDSSSGGTSARKGDKSESAWELTDE